MTNKIILQNQPRKLSTGLGELRGIRPIMLSGVYRSGTTILAQTCKAHPDISVTYDSIKYLRFCLDRFNPQDNPDEAHRLIKETARRVSIRWDIDINPDAIFEKLKGKALNHAAIYNAIMRDVVLDGDDDNRRWSEKIAVMWSKIPDFLTMYPDGHVIHIFRNPKDVTASYKKITFEPGYAYLDAAFNCLDAFYSVRRYREGFG